MKKDIEIKLEKEKTRRLRQMPDFIVDFITSLDHKSTILTQIAYIKDYTVFLEYLLELPEFKDINQISDITVDHLKILKERDIRDFLSYLTSYKKTFKRKDGVEVTQTFTNGQKGKARKITSLHTLFDWLTKEGYDIKDITKHVEVKVNDKREIKNKLEKDDINNLIYTILNDANIETKRELKFHKRTKFRDLTILLILAFTGIRISELVQLDINDISLKEEVMIVTRKGGNQDRVYIPHEILPTLSEFIEERKLVKNVKPEYKDALFLSSQKRRIETRTVRYILDKFKKRTGIDIKVTPHTFRRTFGMHFYNVVSKGDILLTANALGHSSTLTTQKYYAQPNEERKRKYIQAFNYYNTQSEDYEQKEPKNYAATFIDDKLKELSEITGKPIEELKETLGI